MPRLKLTLILLCVLSACASPTNTPPTATTTHLPLTPVESALAPDNPTASPSSEVLASHTIEFQTPDGATLTGELYGVGETSVIFSVMGNCKPGWRETAQLLAAQGLLTLTYQWRGCRSNGSVDEAQIQKFVDDLRGAINFMREQGAQKIILVGASLGGCASAKLTVEANAAGLIVIASPPEISQWGFAIQPEDLATDIPKLFITAESDNTVPATATRQLFDLAGDPKEWLTYPGTAHGTDLFETEHGDALQQTILQFVLEISTAE